MLRNSSDIINHIIKQGFEKVFVATSAGADDFITVTEPQKGFPFAKVPNRPGVKKALKELLRAETGIVVM